MIHPIFSNIKDFRRGQGKLYGLPHLLTFTVMSITAGATSYRRIHTFIHKNWEFLNDNFDISWKKAPAYTTIRNIIIGIDRNELKKA
jgi:hypothetical protein